MLFVWCISHSPNSANSFSGFLWQGFVWVNGNDHFLGPQSPAPAWLEFCPRSSAEHFSSKAAAPSLQLFDYIKNSTKYPDFRPPQISSFNS